MDTLPTEWGSLPGLIFALGMRHGVDADHVATIDALTRLAAPWRARWCGVLFAAGHGAAVLMLMATVALASGGWRPPAWLAPLGAWVSIMLLAALGAATLRAAWHARPGEPVQLRGLRQRLFGTLLGSGRPAAAAGIGALFALSFDTVSLAVMMALSGAAAGGAGHAVLLGLAFVAGMLVTDGLNGFWLAHLLRQGTAAARASRFTALAVGGVSLVVALVGALRLASPAADRWADELGLALGLAVLVAILLTCGRVARRASGRPAGANDDRGSASSRTAAA